MSGPITPQLQGTESPSQIEFLWEKHRKKVSALLWLVVGGIGAYYGWQYIEQSKINAEWSGFTATASLEKTYAQEKAENQYQLFPFELEKLPEYVRAKDVAEIENGLSAASPSQKPYVLLVLARKAASEKNWDKALKALGDLEAGFPTHSLVVATDYPVQAREDKKDPESKKDDAGKKPKEPELVDQQKGSIVALMRAQIERMKGYSVPAHFQQEPIPADSPKVKVELSGGQGSFVIALLKDKAPKHAEKFLELVAAKHWNDFAIDEINRPGKQRYGMELFRFHIGLPTSKSEKKDEWKPEPSKQLLEFENPQGSHFAGAVFGRNQADDKSCADMFWVQASDNPTSDGNDVIFGFVVEGLDVVKKVCELSFDTSQEEDSGRGKPSERVRVVSITALQ